MGYKNNTVPSIAFIESNTTGTGEKFIEAAVNMGFNIIFITSKPQKYKFLKKLLIYPIVIDTTNDRKIYRYLKGIYSLQAVISTSENFVYTASIIAERLSLPFLNHKSITNCRNKYLLVEHLKQLGLPVPKTLLFNSISELMVNLGQFELPVVLKPNIGTGSTGVKLCSSKKEIIDHAKKLINGNVAEILVQEYIVGNEFSVEVIALGKEYYFLGITKKYLGETPYFVEIGHDFPASIGQSLKQKIYINVKKLLQFIGFNFGPAHIELRVFRNKIYIIEVNSRLAGGMIPILIENSQNIKLVDNLIKLYIGKEADFTAKDSIYTKIEFFLPQKEGILKKLPKFEQYLRNDKVVDIHMYKSVGDKIIIKRDFNDRLGFIIVKGKDLQDCSTTIQEVIDGLDFNIESEGNIDMSYSRGRLSSPLDPRVKSILTEASISNVDNLSLLSKINKAHVIMLERCNIISGAHAKLIQDSVKDLERDDFQLIRKDADNPEIGYYFAYEKYLIDKIGIEVAGKIHIGRSRNDINATIQRLKSKEIFRALYSAMWNLRSCIIQVAEKNRTVQMPIYSQYQPAMPATYCYYLLSIESSLAQSMQNLNHIKSMLDISTLGACSGAGTTFPINPCITAKLLGFQKVFTNALNVVATRDAELTLLGIASIIGNTISRIAQDYQLWTTNEFKFFNLPECLCGISSVMPQKKNPYLLEKIKGKAVSISALFFSALSVTQKTTFTNSVEVGTEAFINYQNGFKEFIRSIKLLELIIEGAEPISKNMSRSNIQGLTISTILAEKKATKSNISFRESYNLIGKTISKAIKQNKDPIEAILTLDEDFKSLKKNGYNLLEYGMGPGKGSTSRMLKSAIENLQQDSIFFSKS